MAQRWTRLSRAPHRLGYITGGIVGLLLVGLGLWPFPKTWSHVGFDTALAKRLATGDTVMGPPPTPAMAGLSSATVPKRAIDSDFTAAVLGGFGEGPRYGYQVRTWVAAAAVRTPAIWRWPSSLTQGMVSTLPAAERTLRIVARALRTNDQVHVAEEAQILSLRGKTPAAISGAKAIAIATVPLSPGLLRGVNQGLTTLPSNVASVCASVANPVMGPCNDLTILWVRPGSAAYGPQSRFVGEPP